ncbi:universal stress protein [Nitrosomonas sp. JL21]|uniref:universal stress protein n=1 Tax=Nitrosomonas sp. JL21 TaxID=153949 RepID=UPI001367CD14|nr:universal stress protein [Nitrosomonas sp. JL21]MBL8496286.1 universal stress protein [Nitrosomonas sp.]MCC7090999.1 universal stress protein [Nitrosomonas sp.]MXS76947.1 universal stress protein [Nitrosomonas sp. JL21]
MYKKVMVAVDGSEIAKRALSEAINIANTYNAALCIVHCIGDENESDKEKGNEILERAKSDTNTLTVETRLLVAEAEYGLNGIAEAIAAAVYDWKVDLLVVGTSNRRGLERFYVGSVAEQLVTKVDSSILLVRPE